MENVSFERARDVARKANDWAGSVASAIGDKASAAVEAQKSQLTDNLEGVA